MLDYSAGGEGSHFAPSNQAYLPLKQAGNNGVYNNEDMMSVHSSRSVASAATKSAAASSVSKRGKRGVAAAARAVKTPLAAVGGELKLKKRSSNVSSGEISMMSGTSGGQTIYRKNKAMKEL